MRLNLSKSILVLGLASMLVSNTASAGQSDQSGTSSQPQLSKAAQIISAFGGGNNFNTLAGDTAAEASPLYQLRHRLDTLNAACGEYGWLTGLAERKNEEVEDNYDAIKECQASAQCSPEDLKVFSGALKKLRASSSSKHCSVHRLADLDRDSITNDASVNCTMDLENSCDDELAKTHDEYVDQVLAKADKKSLEQICGAKGWIEQATSDAEKKAGKLEKKIVKCEKDDKCDAKKLAEWKKQEAAFMASSTPACTVSTGHEVDHLDRKKASFECLTAINISCRDVLTMINSSEHPKPWIASQPQDKAGRVPASSVGSSNSASSSQQAPSAK